MLNCYNRRHRWRRSIKRARQSPRRKTCSTPLLKNICKPVKSENIFLSYKSILPSPPPSQLLRFLHTSASARAISSSVPNALLLLWSAYPPYPRGGGSIWGMSRGCGGGGLAIGRVYSRSASRDLSLFFLPLNPPPWYPPSLPLILCRVGVGAIPLLLL